MNELLPLPKITSNKNEIDDSSAKPVEQGGDKLSILTNMVRQKYFDFLEKLLADNYENSATGDVLSSQDIKKCAEYLEFKAVRSCMIVNIYRESILSIFREIRNDTAQKKLNINLTTERICQRKTRRNVQIQTDFRPSTTVMTNSPKPPTKRKHLRNVRVQTNFVDSTAAGSDSEYTMSLDERIRMFEKNFREEGQFSNCFPANRNEHKNRFNQNRKRRHSSISLESPLSSIDSSVHGHRSTERTDSRIDSCTENEGVNLMNTNTSTAISATPIENVEIATDDNIVQEMEALFGNDEETDIFGEVISTVDRTQSVADLNDKTNDECTDMIRLTDATKKSKIKYKNTKDFTVELKNSIWPCEFHMQRMKLHEALRRIADKGFRYGEKIRRTFEDLFGPEDDDEDNSFAPYSPTIELDQILLSSCKKRIAPWIVKHLNPMSDGLIESRFLFKEVAKHIAQKVILQDQYPDEQGIKRAISDFFKTHEYIGSIDDIT